MEKDSGFTLIELIIVIGVIVILAGAVFSRMSGKLEDTRINIAKSELAALVASYQSFRMDTGYWPTSIANLVTNVAPAPGSLLDDDMNPATSYNTTKFKGPYINVETLGVVPKDPWGGAYSLSNSITPNPKEWYFICPSWNNDNNSDKKILARRFP